jgi:DNA-binding MarR family transcriptional regulator
LKELTLTTKRIDALCIVEEMRAANPKGRLSLVEIAKALEVSPGRASRILRELRGAGYINQTSGRSDWRLTKKATAKLDELEGAKDG